jgi:hypothetical protein
MKRNATISAQNQQYERGPSAKEFAAGNIEMIMLARTETNCLS